MESPPRYYLSKAGRRLYWTLQGPLESSISVLPEDLNPDAPREAYFYQTLAETLWHPISHEAITEQPVASIIVEEEHLSDWQNQWYTLNQEGFDENIQPQPEDFPPEFQPLVVTASAADGFVTVHDFVSAVHPWLMGLREQILRARNVEDEDYEPDPDEKLVVAASSPESLSVEDEEEELATLRWLFQGTQQQPQQHTG